MTREMIIKNKIMMLTSRGISNTSQEMLNDARHFLSYSMGKTRTIRNKYLQCAIRNCQVVRGFYRCQGMDI